MGGRQLLVSAQKLEIAWADWGETWYIGSFDQEEAWVDFPDVCKKGQGHFC